MRTYRLSPTGRRTALLLLIGAIAVWGFALWTLRSSLGLSYNPLDFWPSLQASMQAGLGPARLVPALLMIVLVVATPLLVWNILEEWGASYTPTDVGLRFASLGITLTYPWSAIVGVQRIDADSDDPLDELQIEGDFTGQIRNPLLRLLHRQAFGGRRLPIYAGIEARDELLAEIRRRTGLDLPIKTEPAETEETAPAA